MSAARRISLVLLLCAGIAAAAEVTLDVTVAGGPAEKRPVRIEATSATPGIDPVAATIETGGRATLALQPGVWYVAAEGKGLWSAPFPLVVAEAPLSATIAVYPAATLTAKVVLPKGSRPARDATISFKPTPADDARAALPSSSITCPIADDRIACDVPLGTLDLSIHIPTYIPIYRWGLAASPTTNLGTLTFRRGTSISGTVEMPPGPTPPKVEVTLTPLSADHTEQSEQRKPLTVMRARPNERGFFLLVAAPGDYRIAATAEGLISTSYPVRLLEGKVAQLRDPLRLAPPRVITVHVDPPHDPWGKPWIVNLRRNTDRGFREWEKSAQLPADGTWQSPGVPPGMYNLSIRRRSDDAWYSTVLPVEDRDETVDARIDVTQILGKITLGGKPLRANLWFGGKVSGVSVPLHSREDGTFRMMLPTMKDDVWERVDIEASAPRVERTVKNVRLERAEDSPLATVTIDLPATTLEGEAIDEAGAPYGRPVRVDIIDSDRKMMQILSQDGTFSAAALPPGPVRVRAGTPELESEEAVVDLVADQAAKVALTLRPRTMLTGVVRSLWGPAAHASVAAEPPQGGLPFIPYPTDDEGRFTIPLPPTTPEVRTAVYAPGFAFRMLNVRPQGEPVTLLVEQFGGSLTIDIPDSGDARGYLVHNGAVFAAYALAWVARADAERGEEGRWRFTFPLVEEGVYSLCTARYEEAATLTVSPERCSTGVVARHGSLSLVAPRPSSSNLTTASTSR